MVSDVDYSEFLADVKSGNVQSVLVQGSTIRGIRSDNTRFVTYSPETGNDALIGTLLENNVKIRGAEPDNSLWAHAFITWLPFIFIFGIWFYFMRQMQGGGGRGGALSFGKSRARLLGEDQVKITFNDVAGVEEAKEEVTELVDFLSDPGTFQK